MTLEAIQHLWFDGLFWVKACTLDDLWPTRLPRSLRDRTAATALARWVDITDVETGAAIVGLFVDDVLCAQLPESSTFAELEAGPWVDADPDVLREVARRRLSEACEPARSALPWVEAQIGQVRMGFRLNRDDVEGVIGITDQLVFAAFEAD